MHAHTHIYIYIYIYLFIHLFLRVLTFSGKIWENRATMGRESGIEESLFMQMQGQCSDTILAIFRNTYGKRSGSVGGGEGTTNVCAFTWRVKMHSDVFLRSCVTG